MKHLTADRRAQIVDLYRRGVRVQKIADLYGVTTSHVSKLAKFCMPLRRPIERRAAFRNKQGGHLKLTGPAA